MPPKECTTTLSTAEEEPIVFRRPLPSKAAPRTPRGYDFLLLLGGSLALTTYIEATAAHSNERIITDTGFTWTQPLYEHLKSHPTLNDQLAFVNSCALFLPLFYSIYVTKGLGDYELIFRIIFCQLLRSVCGYFTHIAADSHYLASNYDYPDIIHCLFQDCSGEPQVMPFISFFSGHVTNMVIAANDMWTRKLYAWSFLLHSLNVFQIVRMLATRGHYTIDILMGWVVAVYFSSGAGALGRAYSRGTPLWELLPVWKGSYLLETLTGIAFVRGDRETARHQLRREEIEELLLTLRTDEDVDDEQTETTVSLGSFRSSCDGNE